MKTILDFVVYLSHRLPFVYNLTVPVTGDEKIEVKPLCFSLISQSQTVFFDFKCPCRKKESRKIEKQRTLN